MEERCGRAAPRAGRQRSEALKRQWFAIVNPHSGGNGKKLTELLRGLERVADKVVLTTHPGHAAELAREASDYAGIAVAGGDGTLFEVLKGIDRVTQRVALIPGGRGNALARDLGLMRQRDRLSAMHWEPVNCIDLVEVLVTSADGTQATHLSASTIAVGYAVRVAKRAGAFRRLGGMSYAAAAAFLRPRRFGLRIAYGEGPARQARLSGLIANSTHHIANFHGYPEAHYADGIFEVMEMNGGLARQTLHNLSALSGMGLYQPYPLRQATAARMQLETPMELMVDGEIFPGVVDVEIRILPGGLACNRARTQ